MKDSQFISAQLARLAWLDGHEDGTNAMLGCAFVIRNRIRAGWHGGQWHEILSNHHKYSAKVELYPDTIPDPRGFAFMSFLQQVDQIFSGALDDFVTIKQDGDWKYVMSVAPPVAMYYGRLNDITNDWFLQNIARKGDEHPRIAQVGQLFFFA